MPEFSPAVESFLDALIEGGSTNIERSAPMRVGRRHITLSIEITLDEDGIRLLQDELPTWLEDTVDVYRTAVHHIVLDNSPENLMPEVSVQSHISGVTIEDRDDLDGAL